MSCIKEGSFELDSVISFVLAQSRQQTITLDLFQRGETFDTKFYEWGAEKKGKSYVSLSTAITLSATTIDLGFAMSLNQIIQIGDEQMKVDSLSAGTAYNVTRGWAGTVAIAHAIGDIAEFLAQSNPSGCSTAECVIGTVEPYKNIMQEMTYCICGTKRDADMKGKLVADIVDLSRRAEVNKHLAELNRTVLKGRYKDNDPNKSYTFMGIDQFLTTYGIKQSPAVAGTALTEDAVNCFLLKLAEVGSNVDIILLSAKAKAFIVKNFVGYQKMAMQGGAVTLGNVIDGYVSDAFNGRVLRFVVDHEIKDNTLRFLDSSSLYLHAFYSRTNGSEMFMNEVEETNVCSGEFKSTLWTNVTLSMLEPELQGIMSGYDFSTLGC